MPALAVACVAFAGSSPNAPTATASPPARTRCTPPAANTSAGTAFAASAETLYEQRQLDGAAILVQLGLASCEAGASDLARLHVLDGILQIEFFHEEQAQAAFAAAVALDRNPPLPAFMSPKARRLFEAVKAATSFPKEVKVVEVAGGRIVFAAGTAEGFQTGSNVRIISPQQTFSRQGKAVLRVVETTAHSAIAELGRGDLVEPGDLVERTDAPVSEQMYVSRRAPFTSRFGFHARPFVPLLFSAPTTRSYTPIGMLGDGYFTWYFRNAPIAAQLRLAPVGLSEDTTGGHFPTVVTATGSWATDFFEIGFGVGTAWGHDFPTRANFTLATAYILRIGSIDGFNFGCESTLFLGPRAWPGLGTFRVELNLPLTSRLGVFTTGGGGGNGFAFGEAGVRVYSGGVGANGTVIISASGGYTRLFDGSGSAGGPSVGFGMEWRL